MEITKNLIIESNMSDFEFIKSENYCYLTLRTQIDDDTDQIIELNKEGVEKLISFLNDVVKEM